MSISGLTYVSGYVSGSHEAPLLAAVDGEPWRGDLKRRVQHYGYRYDYTARTVDPSMYLGPLPAWAQPLASRLHADGHMPAAPDQLIVNGYEPGQGINAHVDCVPCFGPVVCSVTLGSQCVMELSPVEGGEAQPLLLERGSLLVLAGDARYAWRHGIPGRTHDIVGAQELARGRRVSLTFRTVILDRERR
ncbi:MAG: alpha-ketoglutarate-dependent dioxygenase AlkB [Planctomycetaceae bacterium]